MTASRSCGCPRRSTDGRGAEAPLRVGTPPRGSNPSTEPRRAVAMRRTKVVATLGPATDAPGLLERILRAGVDVVRLNAAHANVEQLAPRLAAVRAAAAVVGTDVAVLLDLPGPKVRVGDVAEGTVLADGNVLLPVRRRVRGRRWSRLRHPCRPVRRRDRWRPHPRRRRPYRARSHRCAAGRGDHARGDGRAADEQQGRQRARRDAVGRHDHAERSLHARMGDDHRCRLGRAVVRALGSRCRGAARAHDRACHPNRRQDREARGRRGDRGDHRCRRRRDGGARGPCGRDRPRAGAGAAAPHHARPCATPVARSSSRPRCSTRCV